LGYVNIDANFWWYSLSEYNMFSKIPAQKKYMKNTFQKLRQLYSELPGVPCNACGECCVSPTCTLIEFLYAMRYAIEHLTKDDLRNVLIQKPRIHPAYEGNLKCLFQEGGSRACQIHPGRSMACRLFSLPVIDSLSIAELENCKNMDDTKRPDVSQNELKKWLENLTQLNQQVASFYVEPYWIAGLNIECWLAIYFDPLLNEGIFGEIRSLLRENLDLAYLDGEYQDFTHLKEKFDKISILYPILDAGDKESATILIEDIRTQYPLTGTYYLYELNNLEAILKEHTR